ncbi:MAG: energy-dependent translational throttle protein EttA, partial [Pirellulales bacterium]|nr:energy-dependent translational throttle protein EttA [Pirellulales bacterium]
MGKKYIYQMGGLTKKYARKVVFNDIWLAFYPGAKIGVLGRNGAGKSTLLKIMAGIDREYDGEATLSDGFTVGYLSQEPQLDPTLNVRGNVEASVAETRAILERFEEINCRLGEPLEGEEMEKLLAEQARVQDRIDAADAWELDRHVEIAMDAVNLPPGDAAVETLSGGERRRVALCKIMLERPDLLLLDEPTNHLDADSVAWLERHLAEYSGTVVAVTHDRYFLDNVAGWILELDRGEGIPWEGNYSSWLEQKQKRLEREQQSARAHQRSLDRELEWIRMTPRARQAKSKARIKAYESMSRENFTERPDEMEIQIPPGERLGQLVVEAKDLSKSYDETVLFEDLNFKLPPGGIVGVVGPNGAGKTTLLRLLTGEEQPDAGQLN